MSRAMNVWLILGHARCGAFVAGELGFEPRQTESESVVLPLHHSPTELLNKSNNLLNYPAMGREAIGKIAVRGDDRSTRYLRGLASARQI